ncbi:MAG: fumarylacetoacetate hydrolase family protein [Bdellovibrionaceae bacterium]|nr:fumarylacetoacetate hydrolase family protein [Bdellovibrio sp.]
MKLATLKSKRSLDGELVVISKDLKSFVRATSIAPNLREAVERWSETEPQLKKLSEELAAGKATGIEKVPDENIFHSVLPRTWLFADGSAFIHHIKLVRKARNADLPETLLTVPLMYQAESGRFLTPTDPIPQRDFAHGTDFEAEVGVITDHVPMGVTPEQALQHIKLLVLINDVSLRGLIPGELAQGFGFFQSKPNKALSPAALTIDELGEHWQNGRVQLPLDVRYNGEFFGKANAKEMHFHFGDLIAHAAKTRDLAAGSLIGSGTVANEDPTAGSSCLAEKRTLEQINNGKITTPFMKVNDTIEIEMRNTKGESLFGRIFQKVQAAE